ncbi:MAG: acetyltransferase [Cellulosilyticaceae bacterium]
MKVAVVGAGGHGKVVIDIVEQIKGMEIMGCINTYENELDRLQAYPIIGYPRDLSCLREIEGVFFAIGDNYKRGQWVQHIQALYPHLVYPVAMHPQSICAKDATIEKGVVIGTGAIVQTGAQVGAFSLINTGAILEHDSVMEAFSSLAPASCTGGGVKIGAYTAIGMHATLLQRVKVGDYSVIGAGAVVTRDIQPCMVAYGVPAKSIRERTKDEAYL